MSAHKLLSRLFLLCGTLLLAIHLRPTTSTFAQQTDSSQCVQVFEQQERFTANVFQLDTSSGQLAKLDYPVIPPFASVSPDGKYAAFLRALDFPEDWKNQQIGLYVGPVDGSQEPTLLTIYRDSKLEEFNGEVEYLFKWSPDSSRLAYIEIEDRQYYVATLRVADRLRLRYQVPGGPTTSNLIVEAYISAWSADSKYLAIIRGAQLWVPYLTIEFMHN